MQHFVEFCEVWDLLLSQFYWLLLRKIKLFHLISTCGNCAFPQNFHTRKLGEITVFYAVFAFKSISFHKFFPKGLVDMSFCFSMTFWYFYRSLITWCVFKFIINMTENTIIPVGNYMLKAKNKTLGQGVEFVQS